MEDSEQRKKRLKEMRKQADQAEVSGGDEGFGMPGSLSNPLIEAPSTMPSRDAAPRFDFYTDPMNAFSSNKRNNASIQAAPDYFPPPNFGGSPMARFSSPHPESANPQMTPSPTHVSPAPYRNPVWNGPRGPAHYNFPFRPSSGGTYPSPRFDPPGSPLYNSAQGVIHRPNHRPFHPSSGGTYPSPRFDPSSSPLYNSAQGVIHWPNNSPNSSPGYRNCPSPSPGRGRGFWHNNRSPVSGRGSGRGPSSHGHWSNVDRAYGSDRFFKRSMVEDPWKLLQPVIWKATDATPENSRSWTSKSVSTKREESSAAYVKPNSEPSLAEYLAAAFNEAANDAESV